MQFNIMLMMKIIKNVITKMNKYLKVKEMFKMLVIKRSEINRMKKNIIDSETKMTELDYFEWAHSNEDWEIIEDVKEVN